MNSIWFLEKLKGKKCFTFQNSCTTNQRLNQQTNNPTKRPTKQLNKQTTSHPANRFFVQSCGSFYYFGFCVFFLHLSFPLRWLDNTFWLVTSSTFQADNYDLTCTAQEFAKQIKFVFFLQSDRQRKRVNIFFCNNMTWNWND